MNVNRKLTAVETEGIYLDHRQEDADRPENRFSWRAARDSLRKI